MEYDKLTTPEPSPTSSTPASSTASQSVPPPIESNKRDKIIVLLKPVGDAPIMKKRLWTVDPDKPISSILTFITTKGLRLEPDQSLFLFVNQAFAPSPDHLIRNLYECFGADGKLIVHYSTTTAWG